MEFFAENSGLVGLIVAAVIVIGATAWYFWCQHQKTRHERHVDKVIRSLGLDTLKDVVLPDGLDGLAFIDYLLLAPKGFVVLDINHQEGLLFGGATVDHWTQVIKGKTHKFNNPLYTHQNHCQAVQWNSDGIDIVGHVVFSNAGRFPKGIPQGVCMIDDLKTRLAGLLSDTPIPEANRKIWERLRDTSINARGQLPRGAVGR